MLLRRREAWRSIDDSRQDAIAGAKSAEVGRESAKREEPETNGLCKPIWPLLDDSCGPRDQHASLRPGDVKRGPSGWRGQPEILGVHRPPSFTPSAATGPCLADQRPAGGRRIGLTAVDGAHFARMDAFGGWVVVRARANEPGALFATLEAMHYYGMRSR